MYLCALVYNSPGFWYNLETWRKVHQVCEFDTQSIHRFTHQHDGLEKKDSWFLEDIEVLDVTGSQMYVFLCRQWLSLHVGDCAVRRELRAQALEKYQKGTLISRAFFFFFVNVLYSVYPDKHSNFIGRPSLSSDVTNVSVSAFYGCISHLYSCLPLFQGVTITETVALNFLVSESQLQA